MTATEQRPRLSWAWVLDRVTVLAQGLAFGSVAGMNTFLFVKHEAAPQFLPQVLPIAFIVTVGVCTGLLVTDARRGMAVATVATGTALLVHVGAWVLPLVLADVHPVTAQLLGVAFTGRAFLTALLVLPLSYFSGYFAVLVGVGYVDG